MLQIYDTGVALAEENMRLDEQFLADLKHPILHLYQWRGFAATYGYFIRPEKHLNFERVAHHRLDLARRPTGGGIVFHIWDLAFSFLLPSTHPAFSENPLENYRFVNRVVLDVVKTYFSLSDPVELAPQDAPLLGADCQHFCMAKPTQYDVVYRGMKIAGSAQRRRRQGYLHQGTLALAQPNFDLLRDVLLFKDDVAAAMQHYSFAPLEAVTPAVRGALQKLLADKLEVALSC